jgi:peptidoglycan/xylan/chitin deacetylase (PgdA/CDA1 family)
LGNHTYSHASFQTTPVAQYEDDTIRGDPNITISGFDATGLTPPLGRIDTTGHIDQTFTYTVGSHQFRFGGEYRHSRLDVFYDELAPGGFTFDGSQGPDRIDAVRGDFHLLRGIEHTAVFQERNHPASGAHFQVSRLPRYPHQRSRDTR